MKDDKSAEKTVKSRKEVYGKLKYVDLYEMARKLIKMHNDFFSHSIVAYDTEKNKIVYYTLMPNEEDNDESLIELYRINANTDFKLMCQCYECINNRKIVDEDLFRECKIENVYMDLSFAKYIWKSIKDRCKNE